MAPARRPAVGDPRRLCRGGYPPLGSAARWEGEARTRSRPLHARSCEGQGSLPSYVLPVLVAAFGDEAITLVATCGLVALLALIYVQGQLLHLNPTLVVLGYRLQGDRRLKIASSPQRR